MATYYTETTGTIEKNQMGLLLVNVKASSASLSFLNTSTKTDNRISTLFLYAAVLHDGL